MPSRLYEEQNPWITFSHSVKEGRLWMLLGEAFSKCEHLAGTPLPPGLASDLASMYLVKGTLGTAAIEGNTLEERQVADILEGGLKLPASQAYLAREVKNVAHALEAIDSSSRAGRSFQISPEWIAQQNLLILDGLEVEEHVQPGVWTNTQLTVGPYRAAPPEDVPYLVRKLCAWLNLTLAPLQDPETPPDKRFFHSFFAAVLGHLYIAWIHPFGDGNGRTARLLECAILAHSGVVPWVSSNVLSDFYNRTRPRYYRRLNEASKAGDVDGFIQYSAEGFVDMLREQIGRVRGLQRTTAWENYVHQAFKDEAHGPTRDRRIELALALAEDKPTPKRLIPKVNTELAVSYAGKHDKTITRDITRLRELRLVRFVRGGYVANIEVMDAFRPISPQWAPLTTN